jgi:hypothetical protein
MFNQSRVRIRVWAGNWELEFQTPNSVTSFQRGGRQTNSCAGSIVDKCKGFDLADNLQVLIQEFRTNPFLVIFFPLLLLLCITIIRITDEPLFLDFSGDLEKWNQQRIQRERNASLMWIQASSNVRIYEKQHKACKYTCLLLET